MKICAHTLVRNEERYVWYAVMSVIDYVDKVLIWDTGSDDKTIEIIKEIKKLRNEKVEVKLLGEVSPKGFTQVRQRMLDKTKSDWFILVDGDEVWWDSAITKVTEEIRKHGDKLDSIVNKYYNIVGDTYHYQEEKAGKYEIDGKVGHLTIRAMNRSIDGLHFIKPHGQQGIFDKGEKLIQERSSKKRIFIDKHAFMHFTHMKRSRAIFDEMVPKRKMKLKYEIGNIFPRDFYYPEVFFKPKPKIVPNVWETMSKDYLIKALVQTPLKKLQRRTFKQKKSGY